MRVLIVEDETAAYESLVEILREIDSNIEVLGNCESVVQTIDWLHNNQVPDLIFMDIHLSDGSAFLIFEHTKVEIPIVFTTAYDQYAIEAFKVNSIDYLLKPIKSEELKRALHKFTKWSQTDVIQYLSRLTQLAPAHSYREKILIPIKDKLLPIDLREVSYFYTTEKSTHVHLRNGESYPYSKTLEQISALLNPTNFYRANKQYIIARDSVKNITIWFDNRLLISLDIDLPERIYVSKNRAAEFKEWIVSK